MLRPQDGPTRERRDLSGIWRFRADPDGVGRHERWFASPLRESRAMPVPASYNDIVPGRELHDHVGDVWYQTTPVVPRSWGDERVVLRLDAATHRATVWVGDREVVSHEGGYTPFEADVTALVTPGEQVRITVAVDNRLTWDTIPPGIIQQTPHGPRQRYMHDFFNYAGIHRPVWLYTTPPGYVSDVTVTTDVPDPLADRVRGTVRYAVEVGGEGGGLGVRVTVVDADGVAVGEATGTEGAIDLDDVHLWQPGEGYQYTLRIELLDEEGGRVDSYQQLFGVRTVEVVGHEFRINGRPFYFTGFGMHEDHLVLGKGQQDALMVHDFELLRWTGANSVRTSHYPYAEEFLEYADAHGIVVIDETAAVGFNGAVSAVLGVPVDNVYGPDTVSDRTKAAHEQHIRELVARDRNHPSVVLWSISNEPESDTQGAVDYFESLFDLTRELDPSRPVCFVNALFAPAGKDRLAQFSDVIVINRYSGWYTETGDLPNAEDALDAELTEWARHGKPVVVGEFGADTIAGLHTLTGAMWSEEFQTEMVAMMLRVFDRHECVQGEHLWNFADFQTSLGIVRVDGNKKGVFTRDRRPKAVAHMLRRRWREGLLLDTPQD